MSSFVIQKIWAREVLDSRGNPTIEVEIHSTGGLMARAIVPSGASTGEREAVELRDGDAKRYLGKGVLHAVSHVRQDIAKAVLNFPLGDQKHFDGILCELDGTPNKSRLGANAILAASMAYVRLSAQVNGVALWKYFAELSGQKGMLLPMPMMNILNGGAHADNNLDFQEIMIVPKKFPSFAEALRAGAEVFHALKKVLRKRKYATGVGDEGGFAPDVTSNTEALECVAEAVTAAGYDLGKNIFMALDVAASEFYKDGHYVLAGEKNLKYSSKELADFYADLKKKFPIFSIEDGMDQNDWDGWKNLSNHFAKDTQLVGDDIFVTNPEILKKGIAEKVGNAVLVKVNQIGTITETLECIALAKRAGYGTVISHRSGETEDTLIADLAVGTNAGQIKTGSLSRTDRIAKYNQLLRIEEALGSSACYGGQD